MAREASEARLPTAAAALVAPALAAPWRAAARCAWQATLLSRLLVWVAGVGAIVAWGLHDANAAAFDPTGFTRPFGALGDALAGPAARWDSAWLLHIAQDGYDDQRAAFFPLYPALLKAGGAVVGSSLVAGIVVSIASLLVALTVLHRLVALDFSGDVARLTVLLVACFPAAFFFSAVYSESLFLALSIGAVYGARTGRWGLAGALGFLAATTRSAGIVLLVPLAVLWLTCPPGRRRPVDALWLLLVPAGLAAYCAALGLAGHDPLAPLRAQEAWDRSFAGPFGAVPAAVGAGWEGIRSIVAGDARPTVPFDPAWLDAGLLASLVAVLVAVVGAVRRLPAAYWLYVVAALALPLSYPVEHQPLMSLPRFVAVLWPLHLWLALWLSGRTRRVQWAVVGASAAGLALLSAEVSMWGWVA